MKAPHSHARIASLLPLLLTLSTSAPHLGALVPDPRFRAEVSGGIVHALEPAPDGKIVIAGEFLQVNGVNREHLARLNPDGTLDAPFAAAHAPDQAVFTLATARDGGIFIGGSFESIGDAARSSIARLLSDGSLDPSFVPLPNGRVYCLAVVPDQIVFGGPFRNVNKNPSIYVSRVAIDGSLNSGFLSALQPAASLEAGASALAVQPDGKIIVGGNFEVQGEFRYLVRLNPNGSLDDSFSADHGRILYVTQFKLMTDGRLLVAGTSDSSGEGFVRRLNADGTVDMSFGSVRFDRAVECIAIDSEGRIVAGGAFSTVNEHRYSNLVRLWHDGTVDAAWEVNANGLVKAVEFDSNGRLLVAGAFTEVAGVPRAGIARLVEAEVRFLSTSGFNGQFTAHLQAEKGKRYIVETSSDLQSWFPTGQATATEEGLAVDERLSEKAQFFRARLVE